MDHAFDVPPTDRELLDFAVGLATRTGQVSAQGSFGEWGSRRKEDGTEVTKIDLAVEELVRNELARHMPEDGSYGEEKGSTAGVSGRRWIIDPINGTTSFTRRWPLFSNDIAYEDKCGPAVGVINMPVRRPRRRRATRQGRRGRSPRTVKSRNFRPPRR
ncbi:MULTISPECIES: inositol monophosphatase family protein [unclassified Streptomyces]|uniref:inositol monophosphatase family protein n=1 Tax=unclassified Streptomyces TaxID=2593676 RepID=UPI00081BA540|nr:MULTISPECIES: inositol monophosphatase family protein [unclassified Streptomyces]MYY19568.1 hypothetical protein [Streptomyces sp. SID4912]SCD47350.1 histidinol-phosphatase [Streptomyces sp. DpondAA-D4]